MGSKRLTLKPHVYVPFLTAIALLVLLPFLFRDSTEEVKTNVSPPTRSRHDLEIDYLRQVAARQTKELTALRLLVANITRLEQSLKENEVKDESQHVGLGEMQAIQSNLTELWSIANSLQNAQASQIKQSKEGVTSERNKARVQHAYSVCDNPEHPVEWRLVNMMADPNMNLLQCLTAKIGTTFWEGFFRFLYYKKENRQGDYKTFMDIPRSVIHQSGEYPEVAKEWQELVKREYTGARPLTFFFTRDPYTRLWSVYLDKEVNYAICDPPMTFTTFLETQGVNLTNDDRHLLPVSSMCNPCHFQVDYIGALETFADDAREILKLVNMESYFPSISHVDYVEHEISSLVEYNFKYPGFVLATCADKEKNVGRNLWKVFQLNGHIRDDVPFPEDLGDYSEHALTEAMLKATRETPISKTESKRQRVNGMMNAYASVPAHLFERIKTRYNYDFEMFGYKRELNVKLL